jgi:hypothetical protein
MRRKGACALTCGTCLLALTGPACARASQSHSLPIAHVARVLAGMIERDASKGSEPAAPRCCATRRLRARYSVSVTQPGALASYLLELETVGAVIRSISVSADVSHSGVSAAGGSSRASDSFEFAIRHHAARGDRWQVSLAGAGSSSITPADPTAPRSGTSFFDECGGLASSVPRDLYEAVLGVVVSAKRARLDVPAFARSDCELLRASAPGDTSARRRAV